MAVEKVAKRYAQALFELARERQSLDEIAREVGELRECLSRSDELRRLVSDPVLTPVQKKQVLREVFEKRLNPFVLEFLLFLVEKRRLNLIDGILNIFHSFYLVEKNIADVQIVSAFPINQDQIDAICQRLKDKYQKDVRSHVTTDLSLIGGFKVRVQDIVYDFSFKTQLERFRQSISTI